MFISLRAQKSTLNDLQGKWNLVTYAVINASLDVTTGQVKLAEGAKTLGEGIADQLKSDMESYTDKLKTAYVEIEGNNFTQLIFDSIKVGTFTLSEKDNYQVMDAKFDDGTSGSFYFVIQQEKLVLYFPLSHKTYAYLKQK
jgi:hypothetical protein